MPFSNVENILGHVCWVGKMILRSIVQRFHFTHHGGRSISTDRDGFQLTSRLMKFNLFDSVLRN